METLQKAAAARLRAPGPPAPRVPRAPGSTRPGPPTPRVPRAPGPPAPRRRCRRPPLSKRPSRSGHFGGAAAALRTTSANASWSLATAQREHLSQGQLGASPRRVRPDLKAALLSRTGTVPQGKRTPARQWSCPSVTQGIFGLPKLLPIAKYKKRRTPFVLRAPEDGSRPQSKPQHIS